MAERGVFPALPAVLAALLLATAADSQESAVDPVEMLRRQQQRLDALSFSVREAELVQRLCSLRPTSPECSTLQADVGSPARAGIAEEAASSLESFEVREIYGSNKRMNAVLSSPIRPRIVVRQGSSLGGSIRVAAIRSDAVVLVEGDRQHVLLLGN